MKTIRLLKADIRPCNRCRERGCQQCNGKGYIIDDQSYDISVPDEPQSASEETPPDDHTPNTTYYRRRADGVCVMCGNQNLETETRCRSCNEINAERVRTSTSTAEI